VVLGWLSSKPRIASTTAPAISHAAPTVEQIQSLALLTTVRVDVADVRLTTLDGYTGGIRVAAVIKGDFYLSTDLSQARLESVDVHRRTATLFLSQPRVISARLDHERTKLFAMNAYGLWQITPGEGPYAEAVNQTYAEAQASVEAAAANAEVRQRARAQAEAVLGAFFRAMHWDVTVQWLGG
jgi:hypothetical protein